MLRKNKIAGDYRMSNLKQIFGLLAVGVVVGWGLPKFISVFSSDKIVINSGIDTALQEPQVTSTKTDDLTAGLALTAKQSAPIIPDDQIDAQQTILNETQLAVIAMLERSSRELNTQDGQNRDTDVHFNHLAVIDQTVRHYYTVHYSYAAIDTAAFMDAQSGAIQTALCGNADLRELIVNLGLTYSYTYLSKDQRKMGEFVITPKSCAS
jgi:hypothetical protein